MNATRDERKAKDIADTVLWARQLGDLPRISDMQNFIKREIDMSNVSAYAGELAEEFIKRNKQWFDIEE